MKYSVLISEYISGNSYLYQEDLILQHFIFVHFAQTCVTTCAVCAIIQAKHDILDNI